MANKLKGNVTVALPAGTGGKLSVYVVGKDGSLLESAPFTDGKARLTNPKDTLKGARVFVGPPFPKEYPGSKINAYTLASAGAQQITVHFSHTDEILIQHLPEQIIITPPFHICDVVGNVSNTITVDGVAQTGPVCKARVHICTVDWYYRWPIWLRPVISASILQQLKDQFAALVPPVVPPAPDPGRAAAKTSLPLRTLTARNARRTPVSTPATLKPLPTAIHETIQSATTDTIHEIVYNHADILYPYLCWWWIFWPWFYRLTEVDVVSTDCNGHFDGLLFSFGSLPVENIYVWVEANIGGSWTTIYRPPFPCHTYWDYACNTDIDITLANPSIPPCNCDVNVSNGTAWFTAIGNQGIASAIQQDPTYTNGYGINTLGCTNLFDPNQLNPFGSTLNLGLAFGAVLPPAGYYRWKATLAYDSKLSPLSGEPTQYITPTIARPYLWQKTDGSWQSGSISLQATDANGNIAYAIPNYDVTTYAGVASNAEWVSFNFTSAYLDSTGIQDGYVVRLELELLNLNAAGIFEVVAVPPSTFQISVNTNPGTGYGGSVPAPAPYLNLDASGNALSLSLMVRVDNAPVTGQINDATLAGSVVTGPNPCGFLEFSDRSQDVVLSFQASEAFNFATFSYAVSKGDVGTILSASGYVFQNASPFTVTAGTYTSSGETVADLLGTCDRAAFAENLVVTHLATNGTSPLWETGGLPYYKGSTEAFALTNS